MRVLTILIACLIYQFAFSTNLEIGASDTVFCEGDSVLLEATNGFNSYEWNTGQTGRIIYVTNGGLYVLEAEDSSGTVYKDSIYIHRYNHTALNYGTNPNPPYLCAGDSIVIELSNGFTNYYWNTGHSGHRNVLYPTQDKTIVIEAIDSNGCESRLQFTVYVDDCDSCDNLLAFKHDTLTSCTGDSIQLEAQNGYSTYEWSDGATGRLRWVTQSGWYILEAEKSNGSICIDSVYVEIHDARELNVYTNPADKIVCAGDSIVMELSGGFTKYFWNIGGDDDRKVYYPTQTKTIVAYAEDSFGCKQRVEFVVTVVNCDSCDGLIEASDTLSCHGDSIQLEAKYGFKHYQWDDGPDGRIRWVHESGWYVLEAEREDGSVCLDSIYIHIYEGQELNVYTNPSDRIVCLGDSIVMELSGGFTHYYWSIGGDGHRKVYYPTETKTVVAYAKDSLGCIQRIEFVVTVVDCDSCSDLIGATHIQKCNGDSVHLEAKNGFKHYEWTDGPDGRLRWVHETGWYVVEAEREDGSVCIDSVYVSISEAAELNIYTNPSSREICFGDSIVIELGGGFEHYYWSTGHRGTRNVLYPFETMTLTILAIDSNGCERRKEIVIHVKNCTNAIQTNNHVGLIKVYPNPASDVIRIEINDPSLMHEWIELIDVNGRILEKQQILNTTEEIDITKMPTTMFFIKIGSYYGRIQIIR